ncbi:hypothetical protein HYC85_026171 [Camellia sinensis]|uniref:MRG domain-containing protein n=1 Tax=Camellia sinensis TaxID=4442 RepID=A0A7J7G2Y2_CAMSI|nr:hypothetical protein HYC85_026171 [Camellia sinensis]
MGNPLDMTEMMIAREMEKRRIREEILTAEQLLRWRELEGEVVREIMMEREIFMQQGSQGLPLAADSLLRRPDGQGVLSLGQRHGFGIGERPVTGLSWQEGRSDGTLSMVRREGGGALGGPLFQCQLEAAMATHGIAIKPTYDLSMSHFLRHISESWPDASETDEQRGERERRGDGEATEVRRGEAAVRRLELNCLSENPFLFAVKLPELMAYVNIEEETLVRLQQKLLDFLKMNQYHKFLPFPKQLIHFYNI